MQPVYFCFAHGAGSSAMSFATLIKHLKDACAENKTSAGFLAMDYRGHGETGFTVSSKEQIEDYSLATMCDDFTECMTAALEVVAEAKPVSCILVGHSLGGSIVTTVAQMGALPSCNAFVVLDVVEGTALDALHSTSQILKQRPASFADMSEAIGWALSSRIISNQVSARSSIPALLRRSPESKRLLWRHDWKPTQAYWQSWFQDLSRKFLSASRSLGKLLILAGTDRLDKPLMIAQMQGAFQMNVIPGAGHFVHEDEPCKVAHIIAAFADRFGKSL
ncbi:Alpha/Beta hydrolase protein [Protomyces lactucae-debilis]|uniref:Protein phosphatase methylesterase 1 n=1 Tax=Protomyces lactucae-debilis TaxID=2754530 RepID=A0A1Y2F921_PROLT|nr:Alpha/Beta hydrolase protein [Protomyces lactucae-debilis]ORY80363.1 Alpha/Beta hydrolase protein [Protomyces lactucae-debilis]